MSLNSRTVVRVALLVFLGATGCDWLFGTDGTPPNCRLTSPVDSAIVSGQVLVEAQASDSFGVERVEFYADGTLLSVDSVASYAAFWDTEDLASGSWHGLHCIAYDPSGNQGFSDTVRVEVREGGQREVYHGVLTVSAASHRSVEFDAVAGDTVAGDARIVGGGLLSRFILLDEDNYNEYRSGGGYAAIFEQQNTGSVSVRAGLVSDGSYRLVFENAGPDSLSCWVRFVLE